ncbi:MAG: hypothetical protein AAGM22_15025 [Acidobacteriota bacterium]
MSSDAAQALEIEQAQHRRRRRRLLLWLIAGGLVLRFFYFVEHTGSAFFRVPILDEAFYDGVARALAAGQDIQLINPAFRSLFYPAFLATFLGLGEAGYPLALAAQHLFGVGTSVAIALLSIRLVGRVTAGAVAGGLYLLAGPPLFFEGELLVTTLFTHLGALLLLHLATVRADSALWRWIVGGALLGLMASARANALILAVAFPIAAALLPGAASRTRRAAAAGAALSGLVATLAASALLQAPYVGRFQLVAGGGGVNLYLGNKRGADGMIPRQDRHQSYDDKYQDSVQLFAYSVYREESGDASSPPDPAAVSRFWLQRTADEIRADPLHWLGLMAKKTLLLSWNREIPNNKSYAFIASEESQLLGFLPVRFWLLLALAGVGACVLVGGRAPPESRGLVFWLVLYLGLLSAAVVLYFVNARYRLPLWPALAVVAGGGGAAFIDLVTAAAGGRAPSLLATGRLRRSAALIAVALATLSLVNWLAIPAITPHRDYFFRSLAHSLKGNDELALEDALASVELEPRDAAGHFQAATMAHRLERYKLAEKHALQAVALEPREPRVFNQLGVILERRRKLSAAYEAYMRATELGTGFAAPWVNAALLELRANEIERAARSIERAENLGDRSVTLQCARAFLEIKRGRVPFGKALLSGAIQRDRSVAQRLIQEHEQPLRLGWGDRKRGDRPPGERGPAAEVPAKPADSAEPTGR